MIAEVFLAITVKESSYLAFIDVLVGGAAHKGNWLKDGNDVEIIFQPPL